MSGEPPLARACSWRSPRSPGDWDGAELACARRRPPDRPPWRRNIPGDHRPPRDLPPRTTSKPWGPPRHHRARLRCFMPIGLTPRLGDFGSGLRRSRARASRAFGRRRPPRSRSQPIDSRRGRVPRGRHARHTAFLDRRVRAPDSDAGRCVVGRRYLRLTPAARRSKRCARAGREETLRAAGDAPGWSSILAPTSPR